MHYEVIERDLPGKEWLDNTKASSSVVGDKLRDALFQDVFTHRKPYRSCQIYHFTNVHIACMHLLPPFFLTLSDIDQTIKAAMTVGGEQ